MKPIIQYADFAKLEIRIGKVLEAGIPEGSEKLIRQVVDFGGEIGQRVIFSGIKQWYSPEELVGKYLPYVVNLEPRKMPFKRATNDERRTTDDERRAMDDERQATSDVEEYEYSEGMLMAVAPLDEAGNHACVLLEPSGGVKAGDEVI